MGNLDGGEERAATQNRAKQNKKHPRNPAGRNHRHSRAFPSSSSRGSPFSTGANRLHMPLPTQRRTPQPDRIVIPLIANYHPSQPRVLFYMSLFLFQTQTLPPTSQVHVRSLSWSQCRLLGVPFGERLPGGCTVADRSPSSHPLPLSCVH